MTPQDMRELQVKYDAGDSLTDDELVSLRNFYSVLINALDAGYLPKYSIMHIDAWSTFKRLDDMYRARK